MSQIHARPIAQQSKAGLRIPKPSIRAIRTVLGLIWIVAGALQYQPFMFSRGFLSQIIAPVAQGQPSWIGAPITWSLHVMSHHLVFYNSIFAAIQVLIGVGLLFRRSMKPALIVSFAWVLGVWWLGEGLGMIPMGMASPLNGAPGAVLLYGLVGALVWSARPDSADCTTTGVTAAAAEPAASWTAPVGRIVWAALWLLAAALWLLPVNRGAGSFHDDVQSASYGWLAPVQHAVANTSDGHGLGIALGLAALSALIGLGVFFPPLVRPALLAGAVLSLAYWAFGQSFGLITTGTATDLNAGPLFVLLALRLAVDPATIAWPSAFRRTRDAIASLAPPQGSRSDGVPATH